VDAETEAQRLLEIAAQHGATSFDGMARLLLAEVMVRGSRLAEADATLQRIDASTLQHTARMATLEALVRAGRGENEDELSTLDVSKVLPLTFRIRLLVLMGRVCPSRLDEAEAA
jgi:hypothetical protein